MNTHQIMDILLNDKDMRNQYGGVWAANALKSPRKITRPKLYIVNTDESNLPGSHWVLFYIPREGYPEFFDSLGRKPYDYHPYFERFLLSYDKSYMQNVKRLQNYESTLCGAYCIFYAVHRCKGYSMRAIVHKFESNTLKQNDALIVEFMKRYRY